MGSAQEDLAKAAQLPEGDVIRLLLEQHARIRQLFTEVKAARGEECRDAFAELRALLAVHETAEQLVLRPASKKTAGEHVAEARTQEEVEATRMLAELEELTVDSPDFAARLATFESDVDRHAEAEEHEEFPAILAGCTEEERQRMGTRLQAAEKVAPTRPHPSVAGSTAATLLTAPLAAIVDRTRDAIQKAS